MIFPLKRKKLTYIFDPSCLHLSLYKYEFVNVNRVIELLVMDTLDYQGLNVSQYDYFRLELKETVEKYHLNLSIYRDIIYGIIFPYLTAIRHYENTNVKVKCNSDNLIVQFTLEREV